MSRQLNKQDTTGVIYRDPARGIVLGAGITKPTDAVIGYAPGCIWIDTDASAGSQVYVNEGTRASADFNILTGVGLSGLTATADEINSVVDLSTNIVNVTAATLALTLASHSGKIVTVNAAAGCAITLPAATGTGARFKIFIGTTITSNTTTITRAGSDTMFGMIYQLADSGATLAAYECPGSTVITMDGTTKGGIKGDWFEIEDVASAVWHIIGHTSATGSEATPVT